MKARNLAAFTLIELLTVMAVIGLLLAILTPPLSRAREMARRGVCLTNLRANGQGCITYALGYNNQFPYAGDPDPGFNAIGDAWDWDGASAQTFDGTAAPAVSPKSNTRHLWKLVQMSITDPKTFRCPSDPLGGDPFEPAAINPTQPGRSSISDVQNRGQFSYAFQYQGPGLQSGGGSTRRAGWNTSTRDDPKLVILADGSPMFRARNPEAILPTDDHTFDLAGQNPTEFPEGVKFRDLLDNIVPTITWNATTAKVDYTMYTPEDMQSLNSQMHRGDGQNIIRLDGSGDFVSNPWAGVQMDNIWTVQDPTEYAKPAASRDANLLLQARMGGLYDGASYTEQNMLEAWMLYRQDSKGKFPDTFLVP